MFVCICNGVTDSDIRQAVDAGASSIRELNQTMSVANCCGKCTRVARQVIKSHLDASRVDELAYEVM